MRKSKIILIAAFNLKRLNYVMICLYCLFLLNISNAQTWTQKANFGGSARSFAVSFSIGNKGYIGTGFNNYSTYFKDFWEWDKSTNTWTRKADFGGLARAYAVGFSIGKKGYIGLGNADNIGNTNDFWEWDGDTTSQTYNTWIRKVDFPGQIRQNAVGFSIGTKGYIGGGQGGEFWEWDGDTTSSTYNTWIRKADFPGDSITDGSRANAVGFSIGKKGYIGTGSNILLCHKEFWEWDGDTTSPTYNIWIRKADFDGINGTGRYGAVGFSIGNKGFIGTGEDNDDIRKDFWEWNGDTSSPNYNTWIRKIDFGGSVRVYAGGFSIGNKGYIGIGYPYGNPFNDFWEYCDTCTTNVIGLNNLLNYAIYPNPATNQFIITFPQIMNATYSLNDLQGNPAKTGKTTNSQTEINVADLPRGMYLLKVVTDKQIIIKKVMLQ